MAHAREQRNSQKGSHLHSFALWPGAAKYRYQATAIKVAANPTQTRLRTSRKPPPPQMKNPVTETVT
jgi:hypothetical protein